MQLSLGSAYTDRCGGRSLWLCREVQAAAAAAAAPPAAVRMIGGMYALVAAAAASGAGSPPLQASKYRRCHSPCGCGRRTPVCSGSASRPGSPGPGWHCPQRRQPPLKNEK